MKLTCKHVTDLHKIWAPNLKVSKLEILIFKYAPFSFSAALLLVAMTVYFNLDYGFVILNYLLPEQNFIMRLFLVPIRGFYFVLSAYLLFTIILGVILIVVHELLTCTHVMSVFNTRTDYYISVFQRKRYQLSNCRSLIYYRLQNDCNVLINLHTQCKLAETICNQTYFYFLPACLLFGGLILVSANYATIRMFKVIEMPVYLGMPILSLLVIVIIQLLFPHASNIFETSCELIQKLRLLMYANKFWSRRCKAERPLQFNFGSLFMAKKSTQMSFMLCLFDRTIDVLMLFR